MKQISNTIEKGNSPMKYLLTIIFALLALTGSVLGQSGNPPGSTAFPYSADAPQWLRAEKLFGIIPSGSIVLPGDALPGTVTITNTTLLSTNAFPLSPGTVWNLSRYSQFITTNADFNISGLGGLSNNFLNVGELEISNSSASTIIAHILFAGNKIGPNTSNDVYIASGKEAYISVEARVNLRTNFVTQVEQ